MRKLVPLLFFAVACRPDFDERESFVDRNMVLGVRFEPAEAKPGDPITATLLVASPAGPIDAPPTSFGFCNTPKLLTENGSVSASCQRGNVAPIGDALGAVTTAMPAEACFTFGPEVKAAELRPRDPDSTGGFYQPIRALVVPAGADAVTSFGFARVKCNLATAGGDLVAQYTARYALNKNPSLLPLEARVNGALVAFDAIPRGAEVVLRAAWKPEDAEGYVSVDQASQTLVPRRESMRVSWFTTAGSFANDRSGRTETELESFTDNVWITPSEPRRVHLFTVLRDARGGMAFAAVAAEVR